MQTRTCRGWTRLPMPMAWLLITAGVALAVGDATRELPAGGRVVGDISKEPGETDTFGLDLVRGQELSLKVTAGFDVRAVLRDGSGATVDLGVGHGRKLTVASRPVADTGRHVLSLASADGSQGAYKLSARVAWPKKLTVSESGPTTLEVWMPAGGSFRGKLISSAGDATITSVEDPTGAQIAGPIEGRRGKVVWRSLRATTDGVYRVTVDAPGGLTGSIVRKVPKAAGAKLDVRNGLSTVSFARDGVQDLFASRCSACHVWANDYAGVTTYAKLAYARMKSGNMPQTGPRVVGADLSLVASWVKSGMAP